MWNLRQQRLERGVTCVWYSPTDPLNALKTSKLHMPSLAHDKIALLIFSMTLCKFSFTISLILLSF